MSEEPHQPPFEEFMYYNCDDLLYWKERTDEQVPDTRLRNSFNNRWAHKPIKGSKTTNGYLQVQFQGKNYSYHHLVWYLHHGTLPSLQLDHINRDRTDNNIKNLREVSGSDNCKNLPLKSNNTSGVVGVSRKGNRWQAHIGGDYLGSFTDFEGAVLCRLTAQKERGYHSNHGK